MSQHITHFALSVISFIFCTSLAEHMFSQNGAGRNSVMRMRMPQEMVERNSWFRFYAVIYITVRELDIDLKFYLENHTYIEYKNLVTFLLFEFRIRFIL